MDEPRYGVYCAPDRESALGKLGARVLGRDAWTGDELAQPVLPGVVAERLRELTAAPRHYGLHATLKPPFFLAPGCSEEQLEAAVRRVAENTMPFQVQPLQVQSIGRFLALTLSRPSMELETLARRCVVELESLRKPSTEADLEKRRARGLSPAQDAMLARYGYPYVLDEFRFHVTLTGSIADMQEWEQVYDGLCDLLGPVLQGPVSVRKLYIFRQPSVQEPFTVWREMTLG